jgi:glycosyltransferase involved in cell wall biosynthesis
MDICLNSLAGVEDNYRRVIWPPPPAPRQPFLVSRKLRTSEILKKNDIVYASVCFFSLSEIDRSPMKVAILHQGFIPTYRVRFFELINQADDAEYRVFHGAPPSGTGSRGAPGPFSFPNTRVRNRELRIARWTAIYQPVLRSIIGGRYDAIVLGHEIKFLANIILALVCRLRGTAVLFWGFGYHVSFGPGLSSKPPGWMGRVASPIKNLLTRLATGYLVYTQTGAERLAATGFPARSIFVLRNTVDVTAQCRLHAQLQGADPAQLRIRLGLRPDTVVLLYVGRLLEAKKVDELIEATRRITQRGRTRYSIETVIIGAGPMEDTLRREGAGLANLHMVGEIYDQAVVAEYMRICSAVVIPGFVGLAVNHAFAQGRPIITREHGLHSPEIEYVIPGVNGLNISGDIDNFISMLERFVDDEALRSTLADGALRSRDDLLIETMATQFDAAVRATVGPRPVEPPTVGRP